MSKFIPWLKERATQLNDSESEEANKQPQFSPRLSVKQMKSNLPGDKPLQRRYWFITLVGGGALAFLGVWWSLERSLPPTAELLPL